MIAYLVDEVGLRKKLNQHQTYTHFLAHSTSNFLYYPQIERKLEMTRNVAPPIHLICIGIGGFHLVSIKFPQSKSSIASL